MFTKLGRVVGFLAIALGFTALIGSFIVAPDVLASDFNRNAMRQSALWLSQGAMLIFFGLVLGVLCEISAKMDK